MAKRFEPLSEFTRAKKPKLDVSVNRGRPSSPVRSNIVDFWASDDDDVILLATQQAEAVAAETNLQSQAQPHENGVLITESQFAVAVGRATTSTQVLPVTATQCLENTVLEDIFGDDGADAFSSAWKEIPLPTVSTKSTEPDPSTANRRQLAQERQIKFLMERVDALKKDNTKLQKDLVESNDQTGIKTGEVSLLRNELRQVRQQLQASKMEKLALNEKVNKEVLAKETELNFSLVEISELKIRNAKNSVNCTVRENQADTVSTSTEERRNLLRMQKLVISGSASKACAQQTLNKVFASVSESHSLSKSRVLFEVELEQLLLCYAELQTQPQDAFRSTERLIESVCRVFSEFWSYAHSLEAPQKCMLFGYQHFDLQLDDSSAMRETLTQPSVLFRQERAIVLRRYIATLAHICKQYSSVACALFEKQHGKYCVLQIAGEAVSKLGYSFELTQHFGVLEATAALLHSLLQHLESGNEAQLAAIFGLLKHMVFTRPSAWVFRELSQCLVLCGSRPKLLEKLCVNSPSSYFLSDRVRSVYRFAPHSCVIQVYAGLLELCFCDDLCLQPIHFQLLLNICHNHVRFVYDCFANKPEFILRMLPFPNFADEEPAEQEETFSRVAPLASNLTANNNNSSADVSSSKTIAAQDQGCECYVKLCLSVVTLVFQMLYQWTLRQNKSDTSRVAEISQLAVQLLTLIFREYYLTCLFRDSEETTKHYLYLICNWWKDHATLLNFNEMHRRYLKRLRELHFMLKPLHQEANPSNTVNDLADWQRIFNTQPADRVGAEPSFNLNIRNFFNGLKSIDCNFE
ncbi:ATR-interacting protein mus304 [Drosophila busckii]|nr:ATR-interacting protein mus304 [Drosophila busckii]